MWISHARRPILVEELRQALAVNPGDTYLDEEDYPLPKYMVDCSLGSVSIEEESSTIRLVHFSVQEYFCRVRKEIFPLGEQIVTESCLTYLSFDAFGEGRCDSDEKLYDRLQRYPFFKYAARYWGRHGRKYLSENNEKLALKFLRLDLNLESSTQVRYTSEYHYVGHSQDYPKKSSGLHIAASFGLVTLVQLLMDDKGVQPDSKDGYSWTPLSWAAKNGHAGVVQLLLEKGVEVDSKDIIDQTPLLSAVRNGHEDVVKLLQVARGSR
jgi:hypothetical protein